jgi:putative transposase
MRVSRSGFYAWERRPESAHARRDRQLRVRVRASFTTSRGRYGSPRVHADLREAEERVSRKRVARLMREDGLRARGRRRVRRTTIADPTHPVAPNLLDREFTADGPNQRWAGDTTAFALGDGGTLYLAAILDLYSRFVVGWAVSTVNDRQLTLQALERALARRNPNAGLLHHSDRGSTYTSGDYRARLAAHGIACSMSRRGDCYDNAVVESFFSTLKSELADTFTEVATARQELFAYIEGFYNSQRRHSTLGHVSPAAFEQRTRVA